MVLLKKLLCIWYDMHYMLKHGYRSIIVHTFQIVNPLQELSGINSSFLINLKLLI